MNNIVLVGVGGAGVSALARLFLGCGYKNIVGIDASASELTKQLQTEGLHIHLGHGTYTIDPDDLVIYTSAAIDSPEVQAAKNMFAAKEAIRRPFSYFEFLGELSKFFKTIAIAGTHGKSTTTALAASTLAKHNSNFGLGIVGAGLADRGGKNMHISLAHQDDITSILNHIVDPKKVGAEHLCKKYLFVIEACEYNYQFLSLDVDIAVITNIELDHADVYGTFENYLDTFIKFCRKVKTKIITLEGTKGIDIISQSVSTTITQIDIQTFQFKHLLGSHNHANATLAKQLCVFLETPGDIQSPLESFTGLRRRGELLGTNTHGVPIITDYAHHPTELASTLLAVHEKYFQGHKQSDISPLVRGDAEGRGVSTDTTKHKSNHHPGKITLIFQPHQARRVVEFRDEFVDILKTVEDPLIYDIYTAREEVSHIAGYNIQSRYLQGEVQAISSFDDLGKLFVNQCNGSYVTTFQEIQKTLESTTEGVILICTAGNLDWEVRKYITI